MVILPRMWAGLIPAILLDRLSKPLYFLLSLTQAVLHPEVLVARLCLFGVAQISPRLVATTASIPALGLGTRCRSVCTLLLDRRPFSFFRRLTRLDGVALAPGAVGLAHPVKALLVGHPVFQGAHMLRIRRTRRIGINRLAFAGAFVLGECRKRRCQKDEK